MQRKCYAVNESKRQKLIEEMRTRLKPRMTVPILSYQIMCGVSALVFLIPTAWLLPQIVDALANGYTEDIMGFFIVDVFSFCIALLVSIIPRLIKQATDKKWLWKWNGRTMERVTLRERSILWEHWEDDSYWEYQMAYQHVVDLEYNEHEKILYVRGYMNGRQWNSPEREKLIDTIDLDKSLTPVPRMTLPEYFENFEDLQKSLEMATGKQIKQI